ncbi:MAG: LPXTG cell wall anchor domain-containing protein [Pseudonocardiales bacterium]
MTIRHRRTVAVAVAAGLIALCAPASAAPAPATTTNPAAAAAGWLAQQFSDSSNHPAPDGDHFNFPNSTFYWSGLTASSIFALAATKSGGDKIDAAIAFVESNVAADASIGNGPAPGPFDGSVATAALAAIVTGADATDFGHIDLLKTLKDDECKAVSFPADDKDFTTPTCPAVGAGNNTFSSVTESLIVTVEARAGGAYAPSAKALDYFLSLQCADGGFTVSNVATGCTSDVDATGYATAALVALGGHQAELGQAAAWLRGQRNPGGYWVAQGGPNVDSTGLAASALGATGADTSISRAWLASQQVSTGPTIGAGASRGALNFQGAFDASSSIKATADGLLGMVPGASLATLTSAGATRGTAVLALAAPKIASGSVVQGAKQTVTGFGFSAKEKVSGVLHSGPVSLGSVSANASGTVVVTFTVPATLAAGRHTVVLTGATSGLSSTATFIVTATAVAPGTTPSPTVPAPAGSGTQGLANSGLNGQQALLFAWIGLACVLVGSGALYFGRRRRT